MEKDPEAEVSKKEEVVQKVEDEEVKKARAEARHQNLVRIIRARRENDADILLEKAAEKDEDILNGFKHYKFACFCLQANDTKRAEEQY